MNYSQIISNILQNAKIQNLKQSSYPSWVTSDRYDEFNNLLGIIIPKMIQGLISTTILKPVIQISNPNLKEYVKQWLQSYQHPNVRWQDLIQSTQYILNDTQLLSADELQETLALLESILLSVVQTFSSYNQNVLEFTDILTINDMIIVIKAIDDFSTNASFHILSILNKTMLALKSGHKINSIGLYFPLQGEFILFDISEWSSDFYNLRSVGTHIPKKKTISESLMAHIEDYPRFVPPCQMFLRNPKNGLSNINPSDIDEALMLIQEYKIDYFTHSIYIVNLSNVKTLHNLESVKNDLTVTSQIGGKGVVVHVGKSLKMNIEDALNVMESSIRQLLPFATAECPLLLETCAGQGTELCRTIEAFSSFYLRFNGDPRFGICIDTCHVFASGYDPLDYLLRWHESHHGSIKLVHFNDSMKTCGACVDKHAPIGQGHIGYARLLEVAKWTNEKKIPMVIE
jgi:deoxyribonuclease-4